MKRIILMAVLFCLLGVTACGGRGSVAEKSATGSESGATIVPASTLLVKHEIQNATQKLAVCNDGSPGVYYFRPGQEADTTKWIIFLEGGGACSSDAECAERWVTDRQLMSSVDYPATMERDGLFSLSPQKNPDFRHYNHVFIQYCSSDTYLGNSQHTINGNVVQFRGYNIVEAVLSELQDPAIIPDPNLALATELLVAGSSAGAFGVQNHLDRIAGKFPSIPVKGVLDSSWKPVFMDYGKPTPAAGTDLIPPLDGSGYEYYNVVADESCVANNSINPTVCLFSFYLYPYLSTPVFIYNDQQDQNHLRKKEITDPNDPAQAAYLVDYAQAVRDSFAVVYAGYSPLVKKHTALMSERFYQGEIEGYSFAETLANWYFGRSAPIKLVLQP